MRRQHTQSSDAPEAPGAFLNDGSFSETAELRHRGHVDRLVRALVQQRRDGRLSVELAVAAAQAGNAASAFPSLEQWQAVGSWPMVFCSTAAEEAVKREGRDGHDGHWCGERWMPGLMHLCPDDRHRSVACPPETLKQLNLMLDQIGVDDQSAKAAHLRSLGLHPGLAKDDAVAQAGQP